jgi:epoxyqueuosine reductase
MFSADLIRARALEFGFDLIGFAPIEPTPGASSFVDWLSRGFHGEMSYLAREDAAQKRLDPRHLLPSAKAVVIVGVSYETLAAPMEILQDSSRGRIARYAWGADYHDVITPVLREFGDWLGKASRAYVDTGAVLERAWAERCGLGFIGKNTCLIHRERGSHLFLGAVLVDFEMDERRATNGDGRMTNDAIAPDIQSRNPKSLNRKSLCGCGNCTRCLVACPTNAFPEPGVLDARRCISYLTIELKGSIPVELRPLMGNWIFGCDICQDVCPYVRRYSTPTKTKLGQSFYPIDIDRAAPKLVDVLQMDRSAFHARFKNTAILRAKHRGLLRNACVAAGNWGSDTTLPLLKKLVADGEPIVREHAEWAISKITATT